MFRKFFSACLEVVWKIKQRTFDVVHWGSNALRPAKGCSQWVWPSMNQNRSLFIQIQTQSPSMRHHKLKEIIEIVCETTNEIITKEDELLTKLKDLVCWNHHKFLYVNNKGWCVNMGLTLRVCLSVMRHLLSCIHRKLLSFRIASKVIAYLSNPIINFV